MKITSCNNIYISNGENGLFSYLMITDLLYRFSFCFDSRENVENSENNEQAAPNRQVFIDIRIGDP